MKTETPITKTMLRETRGQSFENQFRDAASLCIQLEIQRNQLLEACKLVLAEACKQGNQDYLKRETFDQLLHAIAAAESEAQ